MQCDTKMHHTHGTTNDDAMYVLFDQIQICTAHLHTHTFIILTTTQKHALKIYNNRLGGPAPKEYQSKSLVVCVCVCV